MSLAKALDEAPNAIDVPPMVMLELVNALLAIPLKVPPNVRLPDVVTVPVKVKPLTVPVPPTEVTVPDEPLAHDKVPLPLVTKA